MPGLVPGIHVLWCCVANFRLRRPPPDDLLGAQIVEDRGDGAGGVALVDDEQRAGRAHLSRTHPEVSCGRGIDEPRLDALR